MSAIAAGGLLAEPGHACSMRVAGPAPRTFEPERTHGAACHAHPTGAGNHRPRDDAPGTECAAFAEPHRASAAGAARGSQSRTGTAKGE